MTIKTVVLGGTDWSDGEVLYAADLNDTYGAVSFHRKIFTSAGPDTDDTQAWVDMASGTFTIAANSALITSIYFACTLQHTATGVSLAEAGLKISGTGMTTTYIRSGDQTTWVRLSYTNDNANTASSEFGTAEDFLFRTAETTARPFAVSISPALKTATSGNTTFQVRIKGDTVTISNVVIHVVYVEKFKDD